ncbi:MAG: NAD(P)-dependent oxidoreductase [Thermoprotei archaeon]
MDRKILVACKVPSSSISSIRRLGGEVAVSETQLPKDLGQFDAVLIRGNVKADSNFLSRLKKGCALIRLGVGLDNVDLEAAKQFGIRVCNTPCSSSVSVAEHALGLMLALAKNLVQMDKSVKSGTWPKHDYKGLELRGKTLGVVGFGCSGKELAKLAKALGMTILAYDKYEPVGADIKADYDELLSRSDFISFHVPLTEETRGLLDIAHLEVLKRGVFIINTSRGEVVSARALLMGLEQGIIAGAGIDVLPHEPPKTVEENRLAKDPRVIITPHVAGNTKEAEEKSVDMACSILEKLWKERCG